MPRRCLDCDTIYAALRQCPKCGSTRQLYLPPPEADAPEPVAINAWLALAHVLIVTGLTHGQPGIGLGTALFALGLCASLVLIGTEKAQRGLSAVWALCGFTQIVYLVTTDQATANAIGLVIAIVGFLHALPWHLPLAGGMMLVGFALNLALVFGIILHGIGLPPPGWWHGQHPPLLTAGKVAAKELTKPPRVLPGPEQPRP